MATNGTNGVNGNDGVSGWKHYNEGTFLFTVSSYQSNCSYDHVANSPLS